MAGRSSKHSPELSGGRRWIFPLLAMSLPVFLLIAVEIGLRLAGVGFPTNFALPRTLNEQLRWTDNPQFSWQFFGQDLARPVDPFAITPETNRDSYRVVLLGGSAAKGVPEPTFGMAHALQVLLQHRYPGVHFEVINAAITASNSHVMLPVARAMSRLNTDLFVVYLGNNEVVGPYGAGTVFNPLGSSSWSARIAIWLRALRIAQILKSFVETDDRVWKGMAMFLDNQVRLGDPALTATQENFAANLRSMVATAKGSGAALVLSTVGVNLRDSPPFASLHAADLTATELERWKGLYHRATALLAAGDCRAAVKILLEAASIDDDYAELHARLAQCQEALGDYEAARLSYETARELDTLRFRADSRINAIIREVAADHADDGIVLADAEAGLAAAAPNGIVGNESFYEHVHLRFPGTFVVATAVVNAVDSILPHWVRQHRADQPALTQDQCAERMGYTGLDHYKEVTEMIRMVGDPPFTNQLDHDTALAALRQERKALQPWTRGQRLEQALTSQGSIVENGSAPVALRAYHAAALLDHQDDRDGAGKGESSRDAVQAAQILAAL